MKNYQILAKNYLLMQDIVCNIMRLNRTDSINCERALIDNRQLINKLGQELWIHTFLQMWNSYRLGFKCVLVCTNLTIAPSSQTNKQVQVSLVNFLQSIYQPDILHAKAH